MSSEVNTFLTRKSSLSRTIYGARGTELPSSFGSDVLGEGCVTPPRHWCFVGGPWPRHWMLHPHTIA
eukprot:6246900-Amphidinium_carterae.1